VLDPAQVDPSLVAMLSVLAANFAGQCMAATMGLVGVTLSV